MGGTVNVAIRFKSGEAICQERWTNNTPRLFKHPKMFSGDEDYVRAYIAMTAEHDFRADPFALGMPANVVDGQYGLIVFDYMTNTILDNNGYSIYNNLEMVHFLSDRDEETKDYLRALCDAGLVHVRRVFRSDSGKNRREEIDSKPISLEDAIALSKKEYEAERAQFLRTLDSLDPNKPPMQNQDRCYMDFLIDTSPMTYIVFNDRTSESKGLYREKLAEIGFPMNSKQGLNKTLKTNMSMTAIQKARKAANAKSFLGVSIELFRDCDIAAILKRHQVYGCLDHPQQCFFVGPGKGGSAMPHRLAASMRLGPFHSHDDIEAFMAWLALTHAT